ncbi:MAG TPA: hypothetical protein PLI47_05595 [Bacteroidia bacterium]|nr:hypothetical protein [Bacteroidia bacterium]
MKKLIFAIATMLVIAGCDNRQAEIDSAKRTSDSLSSVISERDNSINEFLASFSEIESNLDSVAHKQNAINVNVEKQGELKSTSRERINENIAAINELMDQNRKKIAELNRKVKASGGKIKEFEKMIQSLNDQLATKDRELVELNEKLANLNTQVAQLQTNVETLNAESTAKTKVIDDQTAVMHTAYYVVGKQKELQDLKVINRTGGFIGIGKSPALAPNVDNSKFNKIDYVVTNNIPIDSKTAKIVTSHPADSYTLNTENKKVVSLSITNPEKFWSASKYLVVVKN